MTSLLLLKSLLFAKALRKKRKTMDTTSGVKLNLKKCRVCLSEKGDMPIFDNIVHPNIPEEIEHFTSISIKKSDKLSKVICQSCLDLLNGCILFRDMCQNNHKKMVNFLKVKECEEVKVSIKEEVFDSDENNEQPQDSEMPVNSDSDDSLPLKPQRRGAIFTCPRCNLECKESKAYKIHAAKCIENEHNKDGTKKTFLCDTCGKTSKSRASLLTHMAIHENIFPFKCDACPYQGRTMDLLKVHKRSHLVEKPYKCTQCPKATTTSSNLNKHMRHVHSTTRPFKCSYCDKAFSYQHDMKRHIKDIHLRQGTVECDICYKSFNTKKILQGHRWKIHKIKGERHGRLPSYLQCQPGKPSENSLTDPTETDICEVLVNNNGGTQ